MSRKSKFRSLAAAFVTAVMVLTVGVTSAFAAGGGTITVTNARVGETYSVYKVFDAVGDGTGATGKISYKLMPGKKDAPAGFSVDGAGNVTYSGTGQNGQLTDADIAAIAKYVKSDEAVASQNADSTTVTFNNLEDGYYYITTTSGTAVTVDSTNHKVEVADKNEAPTITKKAIRVVENAGSLDADGKNVIAQIGAVVHYEAKITVAKGAKNYVFHDTMANSLTCNNDVAVSYGDQMVTPDSTNFTVNAPGEKGDAITINFNDSWLADKVGQVVTIAYSATVNKDAVAGQTAFTNTAWVAFGAKGSTDKQIVKHYTAKLEITKVDGDKKPLAGAGFVLKKKGADEYYYWDEAKNVATWVSDIKKAELKTTDVSNILTFNGLRDGEYILMETTVPAGYNKAEDKSITIDADDYSDKNLCQTAEVVNKAGSLLPSTGGMGTTLLYVGGAVLVVGAVVMLVVRRRMSENN